MTPLCTRIAAGFLAALATTTLRGQSESADDLALARHFGFGPMQIYKFKHGLSELRLADLDADGRTDILLWNAQQSRFELLYQPAASDAGAPGGAQAAPAPEPERNEPVNVGDMRIEHVPVAYRAASVAVADLTADGRNDIVFFGEPRELVIIAARSAGGFDPPVGIRAPEGNPRPGSLVAADFDGDGRTDVAVLGDEVVLLYAQKAGGGLAQPTRLVHNVKQCFGLAAADLDGDGADDLLIVSGDQTYGLEVRLQQAGGGLGPQRRVKIPTLRSLTVARRSGPDELLAIDHQTGRLKLLRWGRPQTEAADPDWPMRSYSYPTVTRGKLRPVAIGDVTHDGRTDIVAGDPDAAQLVLFPQLRDSGLGAGVAYPGLVKVLDVQVADVDLDGSNEVISVSAEEKTIGVSRYLDGRLTFPAPLPVVGEPHVAAVGGARSSGPADLLAYLSKVDGKFALRVRRLADPSSEAVVELERLEDDPGGLRFADVNQDGSNDLLLFLRFGGVHTFIQAAGGAFEPLSGPAAREGLVKKVLLTGFAQADVTGDGTSETILTQKNLARALVVRDGQWEVLDQYNPESADADIAGLCVLPDQSGSPAVVMYDRKSRDLLVLRRRGDGAYGVAQTVPAGSFEPTAMEAAPLGPGGAPAVVLADAATLNVFTPGEPAESLVELQTYETTIRDAWLADSAPGDVNHDGVRDVVLIDRGKAHLEVLTHLADGALVKATRFQVFQGKRFSDAPDTRSDPREVQIADVTGDGIDDVVTLVHDRVIIYPGQ